MTQLEQRRLDTDGYLVLENFVDDTYLGQLRARVEQLYQAEGENAGSEFR